MLSIYLPPNTPPINFITLKHKNCEKFSTIARKSSSSAMFNAKSVFHLNKLGGEVVR